MNELQPVQVHCPYCGEPIELTIDCSLGAQRYIEDCQVCCKPIEVAVRIQHDGLPEVAVRHQDEI
ncbi:CPXCG motif-containing cysteine-rich protein [Oleiagrimonas sp.]|jgi:predicted nucleic acid-binding Zn ribbon protein|uniref:CPXCG motif-containing cysteine-rich protein n=1 Tax=Oleiagrimonas sp. TaxID=2010330 RepID=UPI002601B000|nr:CPXCG motif-containing cysteine-rich protein [Oleiagrimonas sp.]MDA3912677.1 CPXCG motif-containing cysteine-rich protein [Oleiagrimonas sp.]